MLTLIKDCVFDRFAHIRQYACDHWFTCDGNARDIDSRGLQVHVSQVTVIDDRGEIDVWVDHNSDWRIYTDSAYLREIQRLFTQYQIVRNDSFSTAPKFQADFVAA